MSSILIPWLVMGTLLAVLVLFGLRRAKDPLMYLAAFYFYFAFGPVINTLIGNPIYGGTVVHQIPSATVMFALALGAMLLVGAIAPPRSFSPDRAYGGNRYYPILDVLLAVLIVFSVAVLTVVLPTAGPSGKLEQIARVGSNIHYSYLLVQFCVSSLYFIAQQSRVTRTLYWSNFAVYVVYCLATFERDFIFVIVSIMVHRLVVGQIRLRGMHFLAAAALLYLGTFLFELRSPDTTASLASFLNQGSLLFVDTFVLWLVPEAIGFMNGWTYLNSAASLLPNFIRETDFYLLDWFVSLYAPGSPSGYGFSLEAEAYLNFGYAAVPVVFGLLAAAQRLLTNRIDRHPLFAYLSVFYVGWLMYSFRGDSLQLLNGLWAAIALFAVLYVGSRRVGHEVTSEQSPIRPASAPLHGTAP